MSVALRYKHTNTEQILPLAAASDMRAGWTYCLTEPVDLMHYKPSSTWKCTKVHNTEIWCNSHTLWTKACNVIAK